MKIGSKPCFLECTHGFSKNWSKDLVFGPAWPIFNSGLDFIKMNSSQSFMKIGSKLCPLECSHCLTKIWHSDLVFDLTLPLFNSGIDFIKMNILTKFHEDWNKPVPSGCTHGFTKIWPSDLVFDPTWPIFSSPELAQGELLGYCDVRRPSYVWTSVTSETSVRQLFSLCTL